jgi:hypothetical protein
MNADQERAMGPAWNLVRKNHPDHADHEAKRVWFFDSSLELLLTCSCGERFVVSEEAMEKAK